MRSPVAVLHSLVASMSPIDELESAHRTQVLTWLTETDDVFRRIKPAEPDQHLVSYVVPVAPSDGSILLVNHINAGLWLPPGGHVEPDEHPLDAAAREVTEELGLTTTPAPKPLFLTVTRTVGIDSGHTDVSLWFVVDANRDAQLRPDEGEFHEVRWWSRPELRAADAGRFDPHFFRFLRALDQLRTAESSTPRPRR